MVGDLAWSCQVRTDFVVVAGRKDKKSRVKKDVGIPILRMCVHSLLPYKFFYCVAYPLRKCINITYDYYTEKDIYMRHEFTAVIE